MKKQPAFAKYNSNCSRKGITTFRNGPKRTETDRNGPKRTFVDTETDFLGTETDRNGPKRTFVDTETDFLGTETDFSGYRNGLFRYKSKRKAMNRNWYNQKANPALNTKAGNK